MFYEKTEFCKLRQSPFDQLTLSQFINKVDFEIADQILGASHGVSGEVETFLFRRFEDVVDGGRVVADGGLVPAEVPELLAGRAELGVVSRVRRSAVVNHPDVVT